MSSLRKRYDAQVVVPCESAMKAAVRKTAHDFSLSDAEIARMCIETALPTVRSRLTAERERRSTNLAATDPERLAHAS
jgi:hypothetical protein